MFCAALFGLVAIAGCDRSTFVLLHVDAASGLLPVYQLQVTATLGTATSRFTQPIAVGAPLALPKSLSLEVPAGKSGTLQLQIVGLDQTSAGVAFAATSVLLHAGQGIETGVVLAPQNMSCGVLGAPCCNGVICGTSPSGVALSCSGTTCVLPSGCGQAGQPCCSGNTCSTTALSCVNGLCMSGCGQIGQACCSGDTCSTTALACVSGLCMSGCGQPSQPCCGGACQTVSGRAVPCFAGMCGAPLCGTKNNVCCPLQMCQNTSTQQLVCYNNTCQDPICIADPTNVACQ
jgi:hypothetical protein